MKTLPVLTVVCLAFCFTAVDPAEAKKKKRSDPPPIDLPDELPTKYTHPDNVNFPDPEPGDENKKVKKASGTARTKESSSSSSNDKNAMVQAEKGLALPSKFTLEMPKAAGQGNTEQQNTAIEYYDSYFRFPTGEIDYDEPFSITEYNSEDPGDQTELPDISPVYATVGSGADFEFSIKDGFRPVRGDDFELAQVNFVDGEECYFHYDLVLTFEDDTTENISGVMQIPEPSGLFLAGLAAMGLAVRRRRGGSSGRA